MDEIVATIARTWTIRLMANLVALLDANVLYSAPIRDITLQLARNNMIRVRWT